MSRETERALPEDLPPRDSAPVREIALELGRLLEEHKGGSPTVLDLRDMNAWTDFFVIVTATSGAHQDGLERHVKEFTLQRGIEILRRSRKPAAQDDDWRLIDLGAIVIHIMSDRARKFYELERLWSAAPIIYPEKIY
ncbi:MAG: ribosome silencing factor [Treponema sp.]|jgi:ribosome-associated protein|nr:ribosome silencing factor [Treponema sp.]